MEKVKRWLDYSFRIFDMATMKGLYLLLFLVAIIYLMLTSNKKEKGAIYDLQICCVVGIGFLLSPVFGAIASQRSLTQILRLYWTMPFEYVVIYCIINLLFRSNKREKVTIVCVVLLGLIALGRQDNLTYPKVEQKWPWKRIENIYKIPQTVYELCVEIEKAQNGVPCRAAFPLEWALYVRQYDASISMPYGTYLEENENECFVAINAEEIDLNVVEKAASDENLDYFVLNQNKIVRGKTQGYLEIATVKNGEETYVLYHRDNGTT